MQLTSTFRLPKSAKRFIASIGDRAVRDHYKSMRIEAQWQSEQRPVTKDKNAKKNSLLPVTEEI